MSVDAMRSAVRCCRCGHERAAHEHYRGGTECALCPAGGCPSFVDPARRSGLRRLLFWRSGDRA